MLTNRKFLISILVVILGITSYLTANSVKKLPYQAIQPDGKVIDIFVTGDEFYHWLHDGDGYTVVQDSKTLEYCWTILKKDDFIKINLRRMKWIIE